MTAAPQRAEKPTGQPVAEVDPVELLTRGELEPEGRLVDASNTTLRCWVSLGGIRRRCVYKPVAGERPLWDFPDGTLAGREVAAYLVSTAAGWDLVPPTVHRDGPLGPGACQLWIDEDGPPLVGFLPGAEAPESWFPIAAAQDPEGSAYVLAHADDPRLAELAVFDAVVNNADRKGGHVLTTAGGEVFGVDHGVCFHTEPKLRTVLWGWARGPLPAAALERLAGLAEALAGPLAAALRPHLSRAEIAQLVARVGELRRSGQFPVPDPDGPTIPWPPI